MILFQVLLLSGSFICYSSKTPMDPLESVFDPTDLNKYIVHPVCNSYTLDEILDKLRGSLFFAVLI